jgi:hypothetical protein
MRQLDVVWNAISLYLTITAEFGRVQGYGPGYAASPPFHHLSFLSLPLRSACTCLVFAVDIVAAVPLRVLLSPPRNFCEIVTALLRWITVTTVPTIAGKGMHYFRGTGRDGRTFQKNGKCDTIPYQLPVTRAHSPFPHRGPNPSYNMVIRLPYYRHRQLRRDSETIL